MKRSIRYAKPIAVVLVMSAIAAGFASARASGPPTIASLQRQVKALKLQLKAANAPARCSPRTLAFTPTVSLRGVWKGDDGSLTYISESGKDVWWVSMSGLGKRRQSVGRDFANVYRATIGADGTITGEWIDTPRGHIFNPKTATLVLKVFDNNGQAAIKQIREASGGGFGGRLFTPCAEKT